MPDLSTIISRAKARSDMEGSSFIDDGEWAQWATSEYRELYDLIATHPENRLYLTSLTGTFTSGQADYTITPAEGNKIYRVVGCDIRINNGSFYPMTVAGWNERMENDSLLHYNRAYRYKYMLMGRDTDGDVILRFNPTPFNADTYRVWYVPAPGDVADDNIIELYGWDEYIVLGMAVRALTKDESDTRDIRMDKANQAQRITQAIQNMNQGGAGAMTSSEYQPYPWEY